MIFVHERVDPKDERKFRCRNCIARPLLIQVLERHKMIKKYIQFFLKYSNLGSTYVKLNSKHSRPRFYSIPLLRCVLTHRMLKSQNNAKCQICWLPFICWLVFFILLFFHFKPIESILRCLVQNSIAGLPLPFHEVKSFCSNFVVVSTFWALKRRQNYCKSFCSIFVVVSSLEVTTKLLYIIL